LTIKNTWEGKSNLTWSDIESQIEILSKKIQRTGFKFDTIATISRGGLVPARLIADHFDIKKILVDKNVIPRGTIFVDDIYDSGDTFKKIIILVEEPKNFVYATLVVRKGVSCPKQLVYAKKTRGKEYVVFPWDRLESQKSPKSAKD
jgi:hypoxanthine phosphoribosyltransferase